MINVGSRVLFKGEPGVVRFVGETQFAPGVWIGVELQEANGKNDGSVNGDRYFQCLDKHGVFVREGVLEVVDNDDNEALQVEKVRDGGSRNGSRAPSRIHSRSSDVGSDDSSRLKLIIQKLQDKLLVMRSDIDRLKNELETSHSQNTDMENRLLKAEEDLELSAIDKETLEEQNQLFKHEIQALTEQNRSVLEEINSLKNELNIGANIKDSSLMNESTDSLIKRNELLEEALILLRDHTDSEKNSLMQKINHLESRLQPLSNIELRYNETSQKLKDAEIIIADLRNHIETSIHSTEIIERLTDQNNTLLEENQKLKSSVKELEDLRKVDEEIEKFHVETESQLQQELDDLKKYLNNEKEGVSSLEERNKKLYQQAQELQTVITNLQKTQPQKSLDPIEKLTTTSHHNTDLELKLKILKAEVSFKNQELEQIEKNYGKSEQSSLIKTMISLRKYSEIYQLLASYITVESNDLFISLLSVQLKLSLMQFSSFLKYSSSKCEHFITYKEIKLVDLETITEKLTNNIIDQDFRDLPDLNELESKLAQQYADIDSAFENKFRLKYQLEQEIQCMDILLLLIDVLNSEAGKNQYVISNQDLNQLYQLTNGRKIKLDALLNKVDDIDKDISKSSISSITPNLKDFIELLKSEATILSTEKMEISTQVDALCEILQNHSNQEVEWEVISTNNDWFLKNIEKNGYASQEFEQLQHQLEVSKHEIEKKDKQIEELTLKVDVLNSRLMITKETETQLRKFKQDVASLSKEKDELNKRVKGLLDSNHQLTSELHKAKDNALLHNSQFESLLEQKQYNEKADLVSELHSLRKVVRTLTKRNQPDRTWLRTELPKRKPFEKTEADELRLIARDLQRAVLNAKVYSVL